MNVHRPGVMFTEPQQIWDLTLWMGNREHRSTDSAALPFSLARDGMGSKPGEKGEKSAFATGFLLMFTKSLQTS